MKWIALFLFSFSALASDCSELKNDCEYYSCLSNSKHCPDSSYPVSFGKRYCLRYEGRMNRFSDAGRMWIEEVRKCLIRDMESFADDLTCSQIRKRAFKGHVPCYVESGFCQLTVKDKAMVVKTIWPSVRNVYILASGINVLRSCY